MSAPSPALDAACGIDFGTSNTTAALAMGGQVRTVSIDPAAAILGSSPTLLHFDGAVRASFGTAAVQAYLAADLQGRFMQSVKRYLPAPGFEATWVAGRRITIEELVGGYLRYVRSAVEAAAGQGVTRVVLGRPARFHEDPARDALAQERLGRAAAIAGFSEVEFVIEPIAAARSFEAGLAQPVLCLVGDMGGGTCDFTVVRLVPAGAQVADRGSDVVGVAGVPVGGNDLDAGLIRACVLPHFGLGSTYRPFEKRVPLPTDLHMALTRWHRLCLAGTPDDLDFLERAMRTSDDRPGLRRLHELLDERYNWSLFRAVEQAKIDLSGAEDTVLRFHEGGIAVDAPVTRARFESVISGEVAAMGACLDGLIDRIDCGAADIDVVFLTGGTSKVPVVQALFEARFPGRIVAQDAFTSVGQGLGLAALDGLG